ncbi:hypothetical protein [Quadrisphaera sp. KR29]|uniref:hypothetical protein n=1 Tax=Quadrisphaera sp. KR29 TaxID=3461391 RepID=UPI0040444E6F
MSEEQTATATATAAPARQPAPQPARQAAAPLTAAPDAFTFTAPPAPGSVRPGAARPAGPATAPRALVWTATALAVVVLSAFLVLVVSGRVVTEGPVVLVLTATHGVHAGDLAALAAWGLAVSALLASALTGQRPRGRGPLRSRRRTTSARARRRR